MVIDDCCQEDVATVLCMRLGKLCRMPLMTFLSATISIKELA